MQSLKSQGLLAVVIDADALPRFHTKSMLAALRRGNKPIPLLIAGISKRTDIELLKIWSAGAIQGSQRVPATGTGWYAVSAKNDVTRQLGGTRLPLEADDLSYLTIRDGSAVQPIMVASFGSAAYPVFAHARATDTDLFFAAEVHWHDVPVTSDPYRQQSVFASLAPSMFFLHYAAGDHVWQSPGAYANFTIDDLWLREPYGHVNYEALLREENLHNFHTTVAFIPWNFDRIQTAVAPLFRDHLDRFSICVHGNNHVHQEFGPLESHPLSGQSENMRQGLARMDKFTAMTGIPYDAVMVFPHSVAPSATFSELKRNHYLATANSLNVPSDAAAPKGAEFALRAATLHFGNFPSLRRYSSETDVPQAQLAIDAFLGNPMLFYAHESFFATGNDAFNKTADRIHELQPGTQWQSLGYIVRHLYLERLRDDGNYDLRTFSSKAQITNNHGRDTTFVIEKEEDFSLPLNVLVDGKPYPYERKGSRLQLKLFVRQGSTREVSIDYSNELNLANIDVGKKSLRTNAIRLLSDFRDNTVSNSEAGRRFIKSYTENGSAWNFVFAIIAVLLISVLWFLFIRRHKRGSGHPGGVLSAKHLG